MSTSRIDIKGMPDLPNIGYYNKNNIDNSDVTKVGHSPNPHSYSNESLVNNLSTSCLLSPGKKWSSSQGIYTSTEPTVKQYLPKGKDEASLDIPFYLAKSGVLTKNGSNETLNTRINSKCTTDEGKQQITNQIQYLTCQLEQERNRNYSNTDFESVSGNESIKTIFEKFSNIKPVLIIIFGLTIYLFLNGFFGSLDFCSNLFVLIESKSGGSISYWLGIFIGLLIPFITLVISYSFIVCKNLSDLEKDEITKDPYGISNQISSELKAFDIFTLILFLFLFYALVAVLFTVRKSIFGTFIYTIIICGILVIIAVLMYILYAYVPFFNTTDPNNIANDNKELRLFISSKTEISNITSNQYEDANVRKTFLLTFLVMLFIGIFYFKLVSNVESNKMSGGFITGLCASCAILILPAIWVFNFFLAINLFYIYPVIIMIFRFIRYLIMSSIYISYSKIDSLKDSFSEDLIEQLDNFKNYSPSWGLIGIDELKILLNTMGYNNIFSKEIFPNEDDGSNISANKFFASGLLGPFIQKAVGEESNIRGIVFSLVNFILTIIICAIILYGVARIQDV